MPDLSRFATMAVKAGYPGYPDNANRGNQKKYNKINDVTSVTPVTHHNDRKALAAGYAEHACRGAAAYAAWLALNDEEGFGEAPE